MSFDTDPPAVTLEQVTGQELVVKPKTGQELVVKPTNEMERVKNEDTFCPVCFEEYSDTVEQTVTSCSHSICARCIQDPALDNKCPICRGAFDANAASSVNEFFKTAIEKQVDDNPHIKIKNIAYTRADGVATWLMKQLKDFGCSVRCDEANAI